MRMVMEVLCVPLRAGEEVVRAKEFVALLREPVRQVRAEEAGAA